MPIKRDPTAVFDLYREIPSVIHINNLESFVQEIIEAGENDRSAIFQAYKIDLKLPKDSFNYKIYAWKSECDCAFHNLGYPSHILKYIPTALPEQAKTEIATDTFTTLSSTEISTSTYTVQLSQTVAKVKIGEQDEQAFPISIVVLNRYGNTVMKNKMKVKPVPIEFTNLKELKKIVFADPQNNLCLAIFLDEAETVTEGLLADVAKANKILEIAKHVALASEKGIKYFRTQTIESENIYSNAFTSFNIVNNKEKAELVLATWKSADHKCLLV